LVGSADRPWSPTGVAVSGETVYVLEYSHATEESDKGWYPRVRKAPTWREKKILDVYATEEGLNKDYDHFDHAKQRAYTGRVKSLQYSGQAIEYVRFLGERLNARMLWEGYLPNGSKFSWFNHLIANPTSQEEADDKDPQKVLKNVTEKCGLMFKKERRKVPVLVLGPSEKK